MAGVVLPEHVPDAAKARLFRFDIEGGAEYRVALQNFYVITRYNRSPMYAMAVTQLAEAIAAGDGTPAP